MIACLLALALGIGIQPIPRYIATPCTITATATWTDCNRAMRRLLADARRRAVFARWMACAGT